MLNKIVKQDFKKTRTETSQDDKGETQDVLDHKTQINSKKKKEISILTLIFRIYTF